MSQQTVELKISGMHCRSCSMNVDLTLDDLDGVVSSETDLENATSVVVFDDEAVTVDDMIAAIVGAGYQAERAE